MKVWWVDGEREPREAPDPKYPNGIELDISLGKSPACVAVLPYPAPRCGFYAVECETCGVSTLVTTAGRPDDPRSIKIACERRTH
jgi:hypothetical protein